MDELKQENRKVAGWLLYYPERKKEYELRREEILHSSGPSISDPQLVPGGRNVVGDPTGAKGQRLAELEVTERWLKLVEEVEQLLPLKMRLFLKARREYRDCYGRRGWVVAVQHRFSELMNEATGRELELVWVDSRTTFHSWWERIVEYAARQAAKTGLL